MDFLLLTDYIGQDVRSWLISEKKDGFRVIWTGTEFISRNGNVFEAPKWFKAGMPDTPLDGELFAGRGQFYAMQRLMRDGWHGLTFQVFDAPESDGGFSKRLAFLRSLALPDHCELVEHVRCRGTQHLVEFADSIVAAGGEGAVVRNPSARYTPGRSPNAMRWVPVDPERNRQRVA